MRYQFGGAVYATAGAVEEWSCTFNTDKTSLPTSLEFPLIVSAISDFWTRGTSWMPSGHALNFVKASLCDATNHVVGDPVLDGDLTDAGAKDTIHPLQIAVRISLQGTGRGRSKQGGFYLPGCAVQLDAALQSISTLNRVDLASSLHTLFSDLVGAGAGNMVI